MKWNEMKWNGQKTPKFANEVTTSKWDEMRCSEKDSNLAKWFTLKSWNQPRKVNKETGGVEGIKCYKRKRENSGTKWKQEKWMGWHQMHRNGPNLTQLIFIEITRFHCLFWKEEFEIREQSGTHSGKDIL